MLAITTECPRQAGPQAARTVPGNPPTKRRWVPPSTLRYQDGLPSAETYENQIFRKVRGILNKLTPEKFQKLSDDLLRIDLSTSNILKGVIFLIFEKALDEPKYSSMYAQLCKRLSEEAPNFEPPPNPSTFRLLLLNKCKFEFEKRSEILENCTNSNKNDLEEEERRQLAKRKMLGNIKFIGELGKLEILSENIIHKCIQELLNRSRKDYDSSEDLECLCQIMRTCGRILDYDKAQQLMDQYFGRMAKMVENHDLPARIKFMLKDVIDLRNNGWVPREATQVDGPMPINQIRLPDDDRPPSFRNRADRDSDHRSNLSELFRHPMKTRSGLEDMFMGINLGSHVPVIPTHPFPSNGFGGRDNYRGHNNQRSGYNNYNNQRGQYKNNTNSQFNNRKLFLHFSFNIY